MVKDINNKPRISVNKLAEFIDARAARRRQILRDQKFPSDFKGMFYKDAAEAIAVCLASNLENTSVIERTIARLDQQNPDKIGTQLRIQSNIDALESFEAMLDEIDLNGAQPSLASTHRQKLLSKMLRSAFAPISSSKRSARKNSHSSAHSNSISLGRSRLTTRLAMSLPYCKNMPKHTSPTMVRLMVQIAQSWMWEQRKYIPE